MNTSLFIARRLAFKSKAEKSFARPIIRFAVLSMALGMCVMLIAVAIVTGFQQEIRDKVIGFGSHITITSLTSNRSMESSRLLKDQHFYPGISEVDGIRHIQMFASKPGIIETEKDVQGVIVKGIAEDFDWSFFGEKIIDGKALELDAEKAKNEIIVSQIIASKLYLKVGDRVSVYYPDPKKGLSPRNYTVSGIYSTGLADFDKEWILTDIRHIQQINHWGIRARMDISDSSRAGLVGLTAKGLGGEAAFTYHWSDTSRMGAGPHYFEILSDTSFQVVVSDLRHTLPDTVSIDILVDKNSSTPLKAEDWTYSIRNSGSTDQAYIGGFEILLDDYEQLLRMDDIVYENLDFGLKTTTIVDQVPEIFNWLNMLDTNVYIIIALMIAVSVINISSALLILILERTNAIGILKAMGSNSWQIRKIFILQGAYIILRGLFWGNTIGLLLLIIQYTFKPIALDQSNYFLDFVPVSMTWDIVLLLNIGVLIISVLLLILPSYYISKIRTVKAIRFN